MDTNYIYLVYKNNLQKEMEVEFEKANPLAKATFSIKPSQKEMKIVVMDRHFKFIKCYIATEFDCVPEKQSMMDFDFKEYPKSSAACDDEYVRRFFLRFMKNHFASYKEDYKSYLVSQADLDLGETTTL